MNSFISWIGGKKLLKKEILQQFPSEQQYDRYIEVFGGAGWVLFAKEKHADLEIFNDINGELINLYRCVKYHVEELQKELKFILTSREQFFWMKRQNTECMTDIQRAARYYVLIKESYGCNLHSFNMKNIDLMSAIEFMQETSKRLARVIIENRDFEKLINAYDRDTALFYLDPPYYEAEEYYKDKFDKEDHVRLKNILDKMKGLFILSYNDCDEIRELYRDYSIIEVSRLHNLVTKVEVKRYNELIIKNF